MFPDVGNNAVIISLKNGPVVEGDVKVMFESHVSSSRSCHLTKTNPTPFCMDFLLILFSLSSSFFFKSLPKGYEDVPFFFWFNTSFVKNMKYEPLVLIFFLCFHFKS